MEVNNKLNPLVKALLDQINYLFSRENLCNSTYLFKQMTSHLSIPLYILLEERKIAQICNDPETIFQAIQLSPYITLSGDRKFITVRQYPTIRLSANCAQQIKDIQSVLKQKLKKYQLTESTDKQLINITLFEDDQELLQTIAKDICNQEKLIKANLFEDIRIGVHRIKKLKQEHVKGYNGNKNKYSIDKPPQVFIRRALESSDEEEEKAKLVQNGHQKKKYKEATKPIINSEDFPTLQ